LNTITVQLANFSSRRAESIAVIKDVEFKGNDFFGREKFYINPVVVGGKRESGFDLGRLKGTRIGQRTGYVKVNLIYVNKLLEIDVSRLKTGPPSMAAAAAMAITSGS
jgi:hypothetical protein